MDTIKRVHEIWDDACFSKGREGIREWVDKYCCEDVTLLHSQFRHRVEMSGRDAMVDHLSCMLSKLHSYTFNVVEVMQNPNMSDHLAVLLTCDLKLTQDGETMKLHGMDRVEMENGMVKLVEPLYDISGVHRAIDEVHRHEA